MDFSDTPLFRQQCFVDGQWSDADRGTTIEVTNPSTGAVLGSVPRMGAAETRRAVEAADRAWPAWRSRIAKERSATLRRWYELMIENQEVLGPVDNYLSQTIMQVMQIMDMKAWAVLS